MGGGRQEAAGEEPHLGEHVASESLTVSGVHCFGTHTAPPVSAASGPHSNCPLRVYPSEHTRSHLSPVFPVQILLAWSSGFDTHGFATHWPSALRATVRLRSAHKMRQCCQTLLES